MKILVVGGSGFIGRELSKALALAKHQVIIMSRSLLTASIFPVINSLDDLEANYEVIINLAGESLNKRRWNESIKDEIVNSRLSITGKIIDYIKHAKIKPKLLISGSAIGYYGSHLSKIFAEDSLPVDNNFTHNLCNQWESLAMQANELGVRVCLLRTGIVLEKNGGALKEMLMPFKLGLGCSFGDGAQFMSWIHMQDMVGAIEFLLDHDNLKGPFNLTAPEALSNKDFSQKLASILHRPLWFNMPKFLVKLIFGEMGEKLLLEGQNVFPAKLIQAGYKFKYPTLESSLYDILK